MASLREEIVQRITDRFRRTSVGEPPPENDSSIETRKKSAGENQSAQGKGAWDWYSDQTQLDGKRKGKYDEYDKMDRESVEVSSALDIYADNATSGSRDDDGVVEFVSEHDKVVEILTEVKDRLELDGDLWSIAREMVKYGDCFEEVVAYDDGEVHRLKHLDPDTMQVRHDEWGRPDPEFPFVQVDDTGDEVAEFADWQVLHFRMTKDRTSKYGVDGSLLFSIRKIFKQLSMMEDSMVIARLTRAQQRFGFRIDVTGIEPGQPTVDYLSEVKKTLKKKRTIDPATGEMDMKYNPLAVEEDIFLPSREGGGSDVKVLQGASNLGQLADVEYFSKKLFAGLKVPRAWMGFEGDTKARAVITELDVQFARTVRRVQQALIRELRKLFDLVLATRGIDPATYEYQIRLPILSTVDELRDWQLKLVKANVAKAYKNDLNVSTVWVYKNLLDLTDEEIEEMLDAFEDPDSLENRLADAKIPAAFQGEPAAPGKPGTPGVEVGNTSAPDGDEGSAPSQATKTSTVVKPPKDTAPTEESLSRRELRVIRNKLREDLRALDDLTQWEFEHRTGRKLSRR